MSDFLRALLMSTLAGLSTGIGSLLAFFSKRTDKRFLSFSMGFSGGVMIYVSFMELLPSAINGLEDVYGHTKSLIYSNLAFFGGIVLIALIDRLIPEMHNPHESKQMCDVDDIILDRNRLIRTSVMTALGIAIHNFPEGLAAFISSLYQPELAVSIVIAIALHNIPEGIAISVPFYCATGSRKKAFLLSLASGFAEPLGGVIGYLILAPFLGDTLLGLLFAGVAGIMVYISLDELLPAAKEYGDGHLPIYGVIAGMVMMAVNIVIF
ncbi:MAG: zinc transporter ZupT [Ruminococcaceae bacterium]|nr:zinc transporter ZupT [Oscillospiraceae bacterium]